MLPVAQANAIMTLTPAVPHPVFLSVVFAVLVGGQCLASNLISESPYDYRGFMSLGSVNYFTLTQQGSGKSIMLRSDRPHEEVTYLSHDTTTGTLTVKFRGRPYTVKMLNAGGKAVPSLPRQLSRFLPKQDPTKVLKTNYVTPKEFQASKGLSTPHKIVAISGSDASSAQAQVDDTNEASTEAKPRSHGRLDGTQPPKSRHVIPMLPRVDNALTAEEHKARRAGTLSRQ